MLLSRYSCVDNFFRWLFTLITIAAVFPQCSLSLPFCCSPPFTNHWIMRNILCSEQLGNCENCVKWANISHNSFSWDFYDEFFLVFCPRHAVQLYQMCLVFICSVFIKCNFFLMQMCWRCCCCCCCYWRIISGYCSQFPVLCSTHIRSKSDADFYNKIYFYAISDFY